MDTSNSREITRGVADLLGGNRVSDAKIEDSISEVRFMIETDNKETYQLIRPSLSIGCGWESLMKSVTLGNVTMSHRTREPAECLASLHSTMIGLPRAALEN
ncbi:hypothetical protein EVAR_32428_1 [Eumeta japonica]|uniref:Uncharacterized protein n=1 Tax=Eumeta variegata TaxID=151549 RepID=A0A4C1VKI6_EUMVA|nr:hypothetical protein EVAR_32428_1 [Eumeta japonica]